MKIKPVALILSVLLILSLGACNKNLENSSQNSSITSMDSSFLQNDSSQSEGQLTSELTSSEQSNKPSITTSNNENNSIVSSGQSSQNTYTPSTDGKATVSEVYIGGQEYSEFKSSVLNYTYFLDSNATTAPKVHAIQSSGTGKIQITQANGVNGSAKIELNGVVYTIKFIKRDMSAMLNNTNYKLNVSKKLNIAYFGGSVTYGYGASDPEVFSWRAKTTSWFKEQYPNANITAFDASIGGTGSLFGMYRAVNDLKLNTSSKPDLVFIEFAINDVYDGVDSKTNVESIIRTIYKYAPQADIILVFTTDFSNQNTEYAKITAQKAVANAYNLPYISIGSMLCEDIIKENGGKAPTDVNNVVWKKYFTDIVHPSNDGYAKYTQYMTEFLANILLKKNSIPTALVNSYMPTNTLTDLPVNPYAASFKGLTAPSGFYIDEEGYLCGSTSRSSFRFTFTGTNLKLWAWATDKSGTIKVSVDGSPAKEIKLYRNPSNHTIYNIASNLDNKTHTVEVTLYQSSNGSQMKLNSFLISGSNGANGIQFK